jgi:hypothetical protein
MKTLQRVRQQDSRVDLLLRDSGEFCAKGSEFRIQFGSNVMMKAIFDDTGATVEEQHRKLDDLVRFESLVMVTSGLKV